MSSGIRKIISGGQTGVDRAALDVAIELDVPHGGCCPQGRRAEDGSIPHKYQLSELPTTDYAARTEQNVIDADGTLILYFLSMSGGTRLTWKFAKRHMRPCLAIDLRDADLDAAIDSVRQWISDHNIFTLNVAGPRETNVPGIGSAAAEFLRFVLEDESAGGLDSVEGHVNDG